MSESTNIRQFAIHSHVNDNSRQVHDFSELIQMDKQECRICTTFVKPSHLLELVEIYTEIVQQIKEAVGIEIITGNSIPTSICRKCYSDLETVQEFRRKCTESNEYYGSKYDRDKKSRKFDVAFKEEEYNFGPELKIEEKLIEYDAESGESEQDNIENDMLELIDEANTETENENISIPKIPTKPKRSVKRVKKKSTITKEETLVKQKPRERSSFPIICDICGNVFRHKYVFSLHLRRHSETKPYDCELCSYQFYTNSELKRHMRRHTGEKPYECQYCHRKFSDYGTHAKHERTHTNDRPFTCQQCGKAFSCNFVLKNHMLTHTGERPFKCSVCDKAFGRLHNLTTHMKSIYHQQNMLKI